MHCYYINLDAAEGRRTAFEANFARAARPGWTLERIAACDAAHVEKMATPGALRVAEKGCFLSHKKAIQRSLDNEGHAFILEDDSLLCDGAFAIIDSILKTEALTTFDICFTDVGLANVESMSHLARLKKDMAPDAGLKILDLRKLKTFFGATGYIVHDQSKRKLFEILDGVSRLDHAYDLLLRRLIQDRSLEARVIFPFLTTPGELADVSSVQPDSDKFNELITGLFRKLMWRDAEAPALRQTCRLIEQTLSEEARAFGTICAAMMDQKYNNK